MTNSISMPARWRFWESFAEAVELVRDLRDEDAARSFLMGMYDYASWGREPQLDFSDKVVARAWRMIEPNLDATVKRHAAGQLGGKRKAENARKENDMMAMTTDDMKRVKKLTKAMGNVYEATVVPEYDEDALIPDWDFEAHSAFISEDDEHEREMYRAECDAFEMLG